MKPYQQARHNKHVSVVERIRAAKPYRLNLIANALGMDVLELSAFISYQGEMPLLTDLIEIEKKLNEVLK